MIIILEGKMIIKETGKYCLLKDFSTRTPFSTGTLSKGTVIDITQIDDVYHKVIGPQLKDWRFWDMPVKKL